MDTDIEIWKIRKIIKNLSDMKGNGTSMISLILPPGSQISITNKMLTEEYGTASNIKSRVNKLSVQSAITSTQQRLKRYNKVPTNGLVIYCGTVMLETGKERKVTVDMEPFKPINKSLYLCDNRFHTEILECLLEHDEKYGFIIIDGNGTLFGVLAGNVKEVLYKFSVELPKKHGRGGQSALRFARLRLEARHNYIRKVAETAVRYYIKDNKPTVDGIIIAGSAELKKQLADSDLLDGRLKKIIMQLVDVSYGDESGFNEAIGLCSELLQDTKLVKEKKLLIDFFEDISKDTGKICFGLQDTLMGLEMGAVEKLLVWDDLDMIRYRVRDTINNEEKIVVGKEIERGNYEILEETILTEWFVENYKNFGAELLFVSDKSQQGSQFCKGFGGIGGTLRWAVDFSDMIVVDDFEDEEDFFI